ncbi:molybdopterin-dependent oxidoreductase, partial [Bacillus pacificus]|uniref:molybdopterin-dependent oxidoreductase n=1 Tax=Bacillus pacificus TaxID=2026187 RepID=UPI00283D25D1
PVQMTAGTPTQIARHLLQPRPGGDLALIAGLCKTLLEMEDAAKREGGSPVLDHDFIAEHTQGFDAFADALRSKDWAEIEQHSGLKRSAIEILAREYAKAERVLGVYGMGLTQHRAGVETVRMLVSLLLMRGQMGKPGAGICPVRGQSNVQGQRAVWITEKPELAPLDKLAEMFGFTPPREKGTDVVEAAGRGIDGTARA